MSVLFKKLQSQLPKGEVLFPGSKEYEKAVFIGNLQFRSKRPGCVVMAESGNDVQITVNFARKYHFKLNIKNGGHSYAGFCLNQDGIVLDLTRMNKVTIHRNRTVTIEGGAIWDHVYKKLKNDHIQNIIIGGQCPTVGVSGFTLGGGLSPFSRSYGLAIDGLLKMELVTADGKLVTVTNKEKERSKKDLFWSLCGGGGGNFGVTTKMTCKIFRLRKPEVVCGELTWKIPEQQAEFATAMNILNTMQVPDELTIDALWSFDPKGKPQAQFTVIYNGTLAECTRDLAAILACRPDNQLRAMHWTDWEKQEEGFDTLSKIYHHHVSFVFGLGAMTPELTAKISGLMAESPALIKNKKGPNSNGCHILWDHVGGAASRVGATETAYFWRDGVFVMTVKVQWTTAEQESEAMGWAQRCKDVLTPYALQQKAAYLNYIDSTLQNWQEAYYGDNYARLMATKTQWDPENFFYFPLSIELCDESSPSALWQNSGENVRCTPAGQFTPKDITAVLDLVNQARSRKIPIRVVGSGHSWSPLVPTEGWLISMANFNSIVVAGDHKSVTIGSGTTVDALAAVLIANAICLPTNVGHGVGEATYGGVIATGCHGSGINFLSTSDYVIAMEVVTSRGEIRSIDESEPEILDAARVSLGLFGIVTSITLKVEPAFNVKVEEFNMPLERCLETVKEFVTKNDYAEIAWIPFTDQANMQRANRTDEVATRVGFVPQKSVFETNVHNIISATALQALINTPEQTPDIMQTGLRFMPLYNYVCNVTDYLHNADWSAILGFKVADTEISVEIDDDFEVIRKIIMLTREHTERWARAGHYPFNGALGFRFIKNSKATLSQARGNRMTAMVEFDAFYKTPYFEQFAGELLVAIMDECPNGRAHWAKGFQFMPDAVNRMRKSYEKQLQQFMQARARAKVDPDDMFMNDYLRRIFRK